MKIIDKRAIPLTVTFGDLAVGEAFQDHDGDLHIKTDTYTSMYWDEHQQQWFSYSSMHEDDLVIPLEVTYTIERGGRE
jgi:hypothetical protein